MSKLVMALLVVQVLVGGYMFGSIAGSGSARATRLPPLVVFTHAMLGVAAPALWIAYLYTGETAWVWVTLGSLLASVAGGLLLFSRTVGRSDTLRRPAADPADVRVAEKQVPKTVLVGHGLGAALLVGCVLAVGLGA
ncbi:hypothetical protein GCM10023339_39520 [Alloalcanivorax gelatiniphagus]